MGHRIECRLCGHVHYANPAVAVAAFLLDRDGRVLFMRRAHEPAKGKLAIPGGFIDPKERAEDAIRREILEETGLAIGPIEFFATYPNAYVYAEVEYDVLDLFFVARGLDLATAEPRAEVESLATLDPRVVSPEDIAFPSMRRAIADFCRSIEGPA